MQICVSEKYYIACEKQKDGKEKGQEKICLRAWPQFPAFLRSGPDKNGGSGFGSGSDLISVYSEKCNFFGEIGLYFMQISCMTRMHVIFCEFSLWLP